MWKDLSMQQRADLMDIYLSHGISSLDEMKNHYDSRNQFASGGNLFSGEDTPTQQMNNGLNLYIRTNNLGETEYIYQETPDSEEILLTPTNKRFSDDPTNWDYRDASGREYSPRMVSPSSSSALETSEKMGPLEKYVAELNWRAKNDPASIALQGKYTMPAIASAWLAPLGEAFAGTTIASIPATTWANTAMAAGFAGHGLDHTINEGINGWGDAAMTTLEIAPLGRMAKPVYERIVQPGMRLFNSPLTGNWTKVGNREYRLNPNSLGANGIQFESRVITPQITAENAASTTPEQWNAAYRAAYERGDKAEGQRLWDLWFRQHSKNNKLTSENNFPIKLRHNTDSEPWNIYDESHFNSATGDGGWYGKGLYTSGNSWGETAYGKNTMYLYGYMENPAVIPPANIGLDDIPENFTTGYIARDFFNRGISKEDYVKNLSGDALEWSKVYPELISKAINNTEKADGIIVQKEASRIHPFAPFQEVVLPKGTHIKSAEPFTLDDSGRLIDLTDRANFNINDIRYGLLPFGIGLTGYGISQ